LQAHLSAVFVVVANVVSKKLLQMALVESDDVVEQIIAAASHPALSNSVLPGTSNGGRTQAIAIEEIAAGTSNPYFVS
jgi:hypothetical protein